MKKDGKYKNLDEPTDEVVEIVEEAMKWLRQQKIKDIINQEIKDFVKDDDKNEDSE